MQDAAKQYDISLYAAIPYVAGKAGTNLSAFVRLVEGARAETQALPLPELVEVVIERSTLTTHYRNEKEGADRIENLEQLVSAATLFLSEEHYGMDAPAQLGPKVQVAEERSDAISSMQIIDADCAALGNHVTASPLSCRTLRWKPGENQAQVGQDALQLMTVHSAKGLEFDAVFITGLEEGLFPHENSAREEAGLEEERRLMYVAITRAKRRLYLSFAQTRMLHGQTRYNLRSQFLAELPEDALKWLTPPGQQNWFAQRHVIADFAPSRQNKLAAKVSEKSTGWRIGETVYHARFGEGVIVNLEGGGENARANINFGKAGMKLLDLSIAKLERAPGSA